jgi:predicted dehydrogenase
MVVSRREFLGASAAAAAATTLGMNWARRAFAQDTADIRIAVIGFNGQGKGHIDASHDNIVALCDVDEAVLGNMAKEMAEKYKKKVDTYTDFRRLLERKDIDGVSIATPNHTHAMIAIAAAQAGKHVYVEKPASHNIWEGRQMMAAARQNNRVMQVGTQSRSSPSLKEATKWVQGGGLGKILYAVGTCFKPRPGIGKLDKPLEIPATVHYDLWCGPAEKRELFRPKLHYDWHWDWNTGNGDAGNQGIHQMDIARWFLGEPALAPRVIAIGGRLGYEDAGNTPNTQVAYLAYEKAPLIFETRGLPRSKAAQGAAGKWDLDAMDQFRGSGVGVLVQCEKGHVLVPNYTRAEAFDRKGNSVKKWEQPENYDALKTHQDNWLAAVAANDPSRLNADIHEGHLSSSLCHLGGISQRLGEKVRAGEIMEKIAANELLSNAFDRMASHLRANGVDIDGEAVINLGPVLEVDTATEKFASSDAANELRARAKQREEFAVPDLERHGPKTAATGG